MYSERVTCGLSIHCFFLPETEYELLLYSKLTPLLSADIGMSHGVAADPWNILLTPETWG